MLGAVLFLFGIALSAASRSFDAMDMSAAASYSRAALCAPAVLQNWSCGSACTAKPNFVVDEIVSLDTDQVSVLIGYDATQKAIVFAFREVKDPLRWVNALRVAKMGDHPDPACRCQLYGTLHSMWINSLSSKVLPKIERLREKYGSAAHIIFTGHGFGGGLATLAAIDCATHYTKDFSVYTFGEPRIGDYRFSDFVRGNLENRRFRVTHGGDTIALLPPKTKGFRHFGQELWFPKFERHHKVCSAPEGYDPTCSDSAAYNIPAGDDDVQGIADHLVYMDTCMDCSCDASSLRRKYGIRVTDAVLAMLADKRNTTVNEDL